MRFVEDLDFEAASSFAILIFLKHERQVLVFESNMFLKIMGFLLIAIGLTVVNCNENALGFFFDRALRHLVP